MKIFLLLFLVQFNLLFSQEFNEINGVTIDDMSDKSTGIDSCVFFIIEQHDFRIPNERNPNFYIPALSQKSGILISVGTFRTLIQFSNGQFDRLIMLDVAKKILEFNREHLTDIKKIVQANPDSIAAQREEYKKKYHEYLTKFAPADKDYYWDNDEKWRKITDKIEENKIHVIRGNIAHATANNLLLSELKKLHHNITIDLSNVSNYVTEPTLLHDGLKRFADASSDNNVSILATDRPEKNTNGRYVVGEEEFNANYVEWTYYYFPLWIHYFEALVNKTKEPSAVKIENTQSFPELGAQLYIYIVNSLKNNSFNSKETQSVIPWLIKDFLSPYMIEEPIKEEIIKRAFALFKDALQGLDIKQPEEGHLTDMFIEFVDNLKKFNLQYIKDNQSTRTGLLGDLL